MGVAFPKQGVHSWGLYIKDFSILGSMLGSPCSGELPHNYNPAKCIYEIHWASKHAPTQALQAEAVASVLERRTTAAVPA